MTALGRTLGHCRANGLRLWIGCRACNAGQWVDPEGFPEGHDGETVEELQRRRVLACLTCGGAAGVSVYGYAISGPQTQLECWTPDTGRCTPVGASGFPV